MKQCKHCGKVLKYLNAGGIYCSERCRKADRKVNDCCNDLRMAVLRQAQRDGVMGWWPRTEAFGKLFPEIDADILMERMKGEEQ